MWSRFCRTRLTNGARRLFSSPRLVPTLKRSLLLAGTGAIGLSFGYMQTGEMCYKRKQCDNLIPLSDFDDMCESGRIVVAFQGVVYDVTDFTGHPGGIGRLSMASGNDLAAFWSLYTQHNRGHIYEFMQRYRIGKLSDTDALILKKRTHFDNPYVNDPPIKDTLLTNTRYPYNAEAKLEDLGEHWITPIENHFVRNHGLVPDIDPDDYTLEITGEGVETTTFTLDDIRNNFPKVDVTTVIQCNGNRREDYHYIDEKSPAFGPPHWVAGAIANSTWSGARLRDVLKAAGMNVDAISLDQAPLPAEHVELLGYDTDECGNQYCCSFPFDKAVDPFGDVILAYEMNGVPIPRQHGYPVRAIIPGHAGARNCKYLERVFITDNPCADDHNWKQYAVHAPDVGVDKLADFEVYKKELEKDPVVQEMPVQSMITKPAAGSTISPVCTTPHLHGPEHHICVRGIAWGGGGAGVNRVDVSIDGGKNFTRANILPRPVKQQRKGKWSWVFFEKVVPLPRHVIDAIHSGLKIEVELCSKALNSAWNVQPENALPNKNPHGCCVNHWYRVPVKIDPEAHCNRGPPCSEFANKPSGGHFRRPFLNELNTPTD